MVQQIKTNVVTYAKKNKVLFDPISCTNSSILVCRYVQVRTLGCSPLLNYLGVRTIKYNGIFFQINSSLLRSKPFCYICTVNSSLRFQKRNKFILRRKVNGWKRGKRIRWKQTKQKTKQGKRENNHFLFEDENWKTGFPPFFYILKTQTGLYRDL